MSDQMHILPHVRWEQEGSATFEAKRARLLDTLAVIAGLISAGTLRHVLLSGQTVILEAIAALRPDLAAFFVTHSATGQVEVGPWYIHVDDRLVSGESLIRNLLAARVDADRMGAALSSVAYTPASHTAHLPQILRGFNLDTAFVYERSGLPFRWEAPDGSRVLVVSRGDALVLVAADKPLHPTIASQQTTLIAYVAALRTELSDEFRPTHSGELPIEGKGQRSTSARLHLKQKNRALENLLTCTAEPLLALALTHGKLEYAENLRALLSHNWRLLMKNQALLGGSATDAVEDEAELRFRQIEDSSRYLIDRALNALPGKRRSRAQQQHMTYVVVWNSHNWRVRQVIEAALDVPDGCHPIQVVSPLGSEILFSWLPHTRHLSFLAEAPSVGYATYTVMLSESPLSESLVQQSTATTIADAAGSTLSADTGTLNWRHGNAELLNVMRFIDGGDAGDTFGYRAPAEDVIEQAVLVSGIQAESSPIYERLIFRHRMRIAPALRPDGHRDRGVRLLEFTSSATFYDGQPGLYFHTDFTNTAEDHRLRVHLKTGILSDTLVSDSAFGTIKHPTGYPMRGICAVQDENARMGLLSMGLPEVEALCEDQQTTLALTLTRAVRGAQSLRPMSADYALIPLPPHNPSALLRASSSYNAPLQAYQYDQRPDKLIRSYLSIQSSLGTGGESDGDGAILTALKLPQNGRGWIIRLFNPTNETVEVHITPNRKPKYARLTTLAEESQAILEPDGNGTTHIIMPPQKLVTLRLGFS
jgi:mannosylglycerate hydrolase